MWIINHKISCMQKDYFNTARRDFRALSWVSILVIILGIVSTLGGSVAGVILLVIGIVNFAVNFILSRMFKKRSASAPTAAIVWLTIGVLGMIWNVVSQGFNIMMLVTLLIYVYLFTIVLKAKKQGAVNPPANPSPVNPA
jgi:hypothetical protein